MVLARKEVVAFVKEVPYVSVRENYKGVTEQTKEKNSHSVKGVSYCYASELLGGLINFKEMVEDIMADSDKKATAIYLSIEVSKILQSKINDLLLKKDIRGTCILPYAFLTFKDGIIESTSFEDIDLSHFTISSLIVTGKETLKTKTLRVTKEGGVVLCN